MTGIFASTFAIATGVLRAARMAGVRIPDDVSLVGLHDSELADYLAPALTTVRLPVEEMAGRAVDLLVDLIDGGGQLSVMVRTPPVLIVRESTARASKSPDDPSPRSAPLDRHLLDRRSRGAIGLDQSIDPHVFCALRGWRNLRLPSEEAMSHRATKRRRNGLRIGNRASDHLAACRRRMADRGRRNQARRRR